MTCHNPEVQRLLPNNFRREEFIAVLPIASEEATARKLGGLGTQHHALWKAHAAAFSPPSPHFGRLGSPAGWSVC